MRLSIIVAMSRNRAIGRAGGLPWRLPADLRRFRRLTMGHHLLIGRRTWESIGRPLAGRTMVVITRQKQFDVPDGVRVVRCVKDAVALARDAGEDEAFVGGGALIYREMLASADRLYLTRIEADVEGDTFFPDLDLSAWTEVAREDREPDERNPYAHSFLVYDRR